MEKLIANLYDAGYIYLPITDNTVCVYFFELLSKRIGYVMVKYDGTYIVSTDKYHVRFKNPGCVINKLNQLRKAG